MFEGDRIPGHMAVTGTPPASQAGVRASRVRFRAADNSGTGAAAFPELGAAAGPQALGEGASKDGGAGGDGSAGAGRNADMALLAQYREEWVQASRRKARAEAEQARALAKIAELSQRIAREGTPGASGNEDLVLRSFAAECAARVRVSDRVILSQCSDAWKLAANFPRVLAALEGGAITAAHARAITGSGETLPDEARARYEAQALYLAGEMTPGRLRTRLRQVADALQPVTLEERHAVAAGCRRVWIRDLNDGMAELGAELPAVLAYGIYDRLSRGARATRRAAAGASVGAQDGDTRGPADCRDGGDLSGEGWSTGANHGGSATGGEWVDPLDTRGLDQLRADILADLLLTGVPVVPELGDEADAGFGPRGGGVTHTPTHRAGVAGIVPQVTLVLPTGEGAEAATLLGYGPIDAATARQLSAAAPGWNRVGLDETDGVVTTDRYRVTESMRRTLEARDQHCRFPGCRMPTRYCDIDHTVEWTNGGETSLSNTAHLCRRHHALKHPDLHAKVRWSVRQEPGGVLIWKGPGGSEYSDRPEFRYAGRSGAGRGGTGQEGAGQGRAAPESPPESPQKASPKATPKAAPECPTGFPP